MSMSVKVSGRVSIDIPYNSTPLLPTPAPTLPQRHNGCSGIRTKRAPNHVNRESEPSPNAPLGARPKQNGYTPAMIKVSVFYPSSDGARFDMDYYRDRHMALVQERLGA